MKDIYMKTKLQINNILSFSDNKSNISNTILHHNKKINNYTILHLNKKHMILDLHFA